MTRFLRQIRINVRIRRLARTKVDFRAQCLLGRRSGVRNDNQRFQGDFLLRKSGASWGQRSDGLNMLNEEGKSWDGWSTERDGLAHLSASSERQKEPIWSWGGEFFGLSDWEPPFAGEASSDHSQTTFFNHSETLREKVILQNLLV